MGNRFWQRSSIRSNGYSLVTVLPAIGFALTMIPMFFNDYTGKRKEKIQQELNERHEQHETEKAEAGQ